MTTPMITIFSVFYSCLAKILYSFEIFFSFLGMSYYFVQLYQLKYLSEWLFDFVIFQLCVWNNFENASLERAFSPQLSKATRQPLSRNQIELRLFRSHPPPPPPHLWVNRMVWSSRFTKFLWVFHRSLVSKIWCTCLREY